MRFLADVCVARRVAVWLRSQGHDATHLRDEGLQRLRDSAIFAKAVAESRVVLTFDLDFGEIAALAQGKTASVVVFRLRNTTTAHVIARLGSALEQASKVIDAGAVVIVEESRVRVRAIPIGRQHG